jgi:hypothetical protein
VTQGQPKGAGLSFSQAQGLQPLPQPLALGEVSDHFRTDVWNWLYRKIKQNESSRSYSISGEWLAVFGSIHEFFFRSPIDTFNADTDALIYKYRRSMIAGSFIPWNELFDLIQFILRSPYIIGQRTLCTEEMRAIFRTNMLAYDIIDLPADGPTIVPSASPEEGDTIRAAFASLASSPFDGARTHLRNAAEAINGGQPADAIRESVHAVESTVRVIAPNKSFKDALNAIDANANIHPALRDALMKLYGYTSDEKGIRHPLLESDAARVGMSEAVFMFGACASFTTYLINRGRQSGMLKS